MPHQQFDGPGCKLLGMSQEKSAQQRLTWSELPTALQLWVEDTLGSPVVSADSQAGGFSLGTADRLITENGRRAFLKAVSAKEHPGTADLHRQEAKVSAAFTQDAPVAGFIGFTEYKSKDEDTWVALLLADIEGRHPSSPWQPSELKAVFAALDALRDLDVDSALELESAAESVGPELKFWHRLAEGVNLDDLQYVKDTPYYRDLVDLLPLVNKGAADFATEVDEQVAAHLDGTEYVHTDLRADNILLTSDGQAILVDWPWANKGNADLDLGLIAVDALIQDDQLTERQVLELMPAHRRPSLEFLHGCVVALAGYYLYALTQQPSASTNSSLIEMRAHRALALLQRLFG